MLTFEFSGAEGRMTESRVLTSGMVGSRVRFLFSREWEGLQKTAVFTAGEVTRDVPDVYEEAVIPARVLEKPLEQLYVGIYGTNTAGDLVIPTVWVPGPVVRPGADPSGDPSTAPELPVWDRLLAMMGSLMNLDTDARENLVAAINEVAGIRRELQPDWNQADTGRADYIRNRSHWMRDSRVTLNWDGSRLEKQVLYLPSLDRWYCRVSDRTPEAWELTGGSVLLRTGSATELKPVTGAGNTQGENACLVSSGAVLVVYGRDFVLEEEPGTAPETGLYFWFDHRSLDSYVARLSWGQQRFLRLDDRFIPMTVARKGDVGFLLGSQQAELLMTVLKNVTFKTDMTSKMNALAKALGVSGDGTVSRVTLQAINVVYSGGDVPAGTPLNALTGLQVAATYSDGSGEPISGYTLSGEIREGSNTITVIYQGKTATFQVIGTGKSQEGDVPEGCLVLLELTGCTADRENGYVTKGLPLAVRLTAREGYTLEGAEVTVTMGGADISGEACSGGLITIGTVTGDVEIRAEAPAV